MNHYETLEVSPNASTATIKAAYKSLMQRYHPDRNPEPSAAQHAILVGQAYEILSDDEKRATYNLHLKQEAAVASAQMQSEASLRATRTHTRHRAEAATESDNKFRLVWILIIITVLSSLMFLILQRKTRSPDIELSEIRLAISKGDLNRNQLIEKLTRRDEILRANPQFLESERMQEQSARTLRIFLSDLTATVSGSVTPQAEAPQTPTVPQALRIPTVGVMVGSFDAPKMIRFLHDNKASLRQKIETKLASAKVAEIAKADGTQYLQTLIRDVMNEAAGTNMIEDFPASSSEKPGRYGVAEVMLPQSFTMNPL